jgi:hypothetical protein
LTDAITRRENTERIHKAVTYYFVKKMYSVHREVGVQRWGARRIDIMCLDFLSNIVGVEVKSCLADFRADKKWREYLSHVNKMYFAFSQEITKSRVFPEIKAELKAEGVGIMVLGPSGHMKVIAAARYKKLHILRKYELYRKLAWRAGDSKRNIKRTQRVYLK